MLDATVREFFGLNETRGDVGVEIEVEGRRLPTNTPLGWRIENDSSLKANEAYEYISRKPVEARLLTTHLQALKRKFTEHDSVVYDSKRAGVHCHINIQDLTMLQFANFVTLAICFESILIEDCGDERKGNLFCLRVRDAEASIDAWSESFRRGRFNNLNEVKYAFMNVASSSRYGSLEFRGMRSTVEPSIIVPWVEKLIALREAAKILETPCQVIEEFSFQGLREFTQQVFGKAINIPARQEITILEDMRYAQEFAYSRKWS